MLRIYHFKILQFKVIKTDYSELFCIIFYQVSMFKIGRGKVLKLTISVGLSIIIAHLKLC